jgi:hypothetical protein
MLLAKSCLLSAKSLVLRCQINNQNEFLVLLKRSTFCNNSLPLRWNLDYFLPARTISIFEPHQAQRSQCIAVRQRGLGGFPQERLPNPEGVNPANKPVKGK